MHVEKTRSLSLQVLPTVFVLFTEYLLLFLVYQGFSRGQK
ncbi:hypothetical protein ASZ90_017568 [hydrocarbon metagenome]|uniref:Uncharacterized protein n=1 Tax=hydrocarbon metagenome TaxID=938273 RepID=A0A0W8E8Y9_9ZZZZ